MAASPATCSTCPAVKARPQRCAGAGVESPDAVFGNSVHDAAMLVMAKRAFPVNPTPALLEIAAEHGWPVFYPGAVLADSKL